MQTEHPGEDPLLYDIELPLVRTFYPLGFPLEIATNSAEVLSAAEESWKHFEKRFDVAPIRFRIGVVSGGSETCPPPPIVRGQEALITRASDAHNFMVSDTSAGFSFGFLTDSVVKNRGFLRYYFLEGTFWTTASLLHLTPIHGACVSYKGSGVLLCGDSGAGKSSLSYACAKSGWEFLCDDSSNLVRGREDRTVIGNPHQIRFRPSAVELFPELAGQCVRPRITGKLSIELVTSDVSRITTTYESQIDFIVFLHRRDGPAELHAFSKESAIASFERMVRYGSRKVRFAQRKSLQALAAADVFELRYSSLESAVARLESMVRAGRPLDHEFAGGLRSQADA